MGNSLRLLLLAPLFLLFSSEVNAQLENFEDIEALTKKGFFKTYFKDLFSDFTDFGEPLTISGGAGLNMRSYNAYGEDARQDPFFWSLNANLNIRIYKLNLPFSLLVAAKNKESSLPNLKEIIEAFKTNAVDRFQQKKQSFVRFGSSPSYKWMKLHLGHRSMDFSKFTLSNLNFFGAGAELTPGKWRVSAMYGRLAKAEPIDLSLVTPNLPVYQRLGWGTKLGYGTENHSVDLTLFKAWDDPNSIFIPEDHFDQKAPEENFVLGFTGSTLLAKKFRLKADAGASAYAPNSDDAAADGKGIVPPGFFTRRTTSEEYTALDLGLDYETAKFTLGLQLKRIDSDYKSLGAYFFNNDIVDLLGNINFGLLQDKMRFTISSGVQANNLRLLNPTTTTRFVATTDVSYAINDNLNIDANYSNNTTDIAYVLNIGLDSLNAVIVTHDIGSNISYNIPDKAGNQHAFSLSANLQQVLDEIDDPFESASSEMITANLAYNYALAESNWQFSAKTNYNQNELSGSLTRRYGGGFGIGKSIMKGKMNFNIDGNYYQNINIGFDDNANLNSNFSWSWDITKGLTSNFSLGLLRTTGSVQTAFSELTGTFGAQYYFDAQPDMKKWRESITGEVSEELPPAEEPTEEQNEK